MKFHTKTLCCFCAALWTTLWINDAPGAPTYADAIDRVVSGSAARDVQWLRLGHFKSRGIVRRSFRSEFRSEADGELFFLSPNGKNDPTAELRATLEAFAKPVTVNDAEAEARHAQCLYPARRQWAFKKIGWEKVMRDAGISVLRCEHRLTWKKHLDAEGVSLVFASAYLGNAASMFGHTFLKFHSKANKHGRELLDYGVNFAAETGDAGGVPYALFGLLGFYPGRFSMQPFHQTLRTYLNLEGRDLIEYRLRFSAEELDFFVDHLFELERTHFDYYFLTENCSYFLLTAIEAAKPEISLSDEFWYEVIPADSVRVVARTKNLVTATKFRPSLLTILHARADRLTEEEAESARLLVEGEDISATAGITTNALDLALEYGAVRATSEPRFDDINHKLRSLRAQRGGASPTASVATPKRPEEGHDPARIGLIYQRSTDGDTIENRQNQRFGMQFRFAYHNRLSNDDGYLRGTTLEVLRVTAMTDEQDTNKVRFQEITFLDILSAQPQNVFASPLSWRTAFGIRQPYDTRSLGPFLNGGVGRTIEISNYLWITGLIDGEILFNPDLENSAALYMGPRFIATAFLHDEIKLGADYSLMRAITRERHHDRLNVELSYAPLRNLELRMGYNQTFPDRRSEWSIKVYQHLLL